MIEKMRKLSVLMLQSDSEVFLGKLQEMGVVHLEQETFAETEELTELQDQIITLKKTEVHLHDFRETEVKHKAKEFTDVEELRAEVDRLVGELTHLHVKREALHKQVELIKPWGEFDPELIAKLEERNVFLSYYSLPAAKFNGLDLADYTVEVINEIHKQVHFVIISEGKPDSEKIGLQEDQLPLRSLADVKKELEKTEKDVHGIESLLGAYYKQRKLIEEKITELEDKKEYLLATLTLQPEAEGHVMKLSGYVPESDIENLSAFMDKSDVVYLVEEPDAVEPPPIKLKNRAAARLFEPITKMYGLPKYTELDTTPFFAPFFALFFGVCLADVGYGLVILALSLFLNVKSKGKPFRPFTVMGIMFGLTTALAGVVLNTVFGVQILMIPGIPEIVKKFVFFYDNSRAIPFALTLGVAQMLFGMCMQIVNKRKEEGPAASFQPIGKMIAFVGLLIMLINWQGPNLMIGPIAFGKMITSIPNSFNLGGIIAITGVVVILFSHNLNKKIYIRPLVGLWDLYNIIVGFLGDFLSYIRLFALGLSGALLGGAMNQIAMLIRGDEPGIVNIVFMILVLVVGHTLNFALAALGAFVHPLRLTFVEFYNAVGFSGGGKMYTPFNKKIAINGGKK